MSRVLLNYKEDFKEYGTGMSRYTGWIKRRWKWRDWGGQTQIVKGLKKFHFEEFELDPEAVKKLFNPFKQKMDIMNAV